MSDKVTSRSDYLKLMYGGYADRVSNLSSDNMNALGDSSIESLSTSLNNQATNLQNKIKQENEPATDTKERNGWQRFWDTADSVGLSLAEGMLSWFDDIWDFGVTTADAIAGGGNQWATDLKTYDWQSSVQKGANLLNVMHAFNGDMFTSDYWSKGWDSESAREMINDTLNNSYLNNLGEGTTEFVRGVENSIGYMIPSIVAAWISGGGSLAAQGAAATMSNTASLAVMGAGAFAGSTSDYYDENGGNYGRAVLGGAANAAVEVATEKLIGFGGSASSNLIIRMGKEALEEGAEEVVSGALDPLKDLLGGTKNLGDVKESYIGDDALNFWVTGRDSVLMQGVSGAVTGAIMNSPKTVADFKNQQIYSAHGETLLTNFSDIYENGAERLKYEEGSKDYVKATKKWFQSINDFKTEMNNFLNDPNVTESQKENVKKALKELVDDTRNTNLNDSFKNVLDELETDSGNKFLMRIRMNQLSGKSLSNSKLQYGKVEGDENFASLTKDADGNNIITIDYDKMSDNQVSSLVHEQVGHIIANDIIGDNALAQLFFQITDSDYYAKNHTALEKAYAKEYQVNENGEYILDENGNKVKSEYGRLKTEVSDQAATDYYRREVLANYLTDIFSNKETLNKGLLGSTGVQLFDKLLGKGEFTKSLKNEKAARTFIAMVDEFTKHNSKQLNNVFRKVMEGKEVSKKEQSVIDEYSNLFKVLNTYEGRVVFNQKGLIIMSNQSVVANATNLNGSKHANVVKNTSQKIVGAKVVNLNSVESVVSEIETSTKLITGNDKFIWNGKSTTARKIFESYNLFGENVAKDDVKRFVKDLYDQDIGNGQKYSDLLKEQTKDFKLDEAIDYQTELIMKALQSKSVDSEATVVFNNLYRTINSLEIKLAERKATTKLIKSILGKQKKTAKILAKNNVSSGTGNLVIDNTGVKALDSFMSTFRFTTEGYMSNVNVSNLKTMIDNGSYEGMIRGLFLLANGNTELSLEQQTTLDMFLDLADKIIKGGDIKSMHMTVQQMDDLGALIKGTWKAYENSKDTALAREKARIKPIHDKVVQESSKYSKDGLVKKTILNVASDFTSPKLVLGMMLGGTESTEFKSVWNDLVRDPYVKYKTDSTAYRMQADTLWESIKKNKNKVIEIEGLGKVNRYVLWNYYLNSLSPDNVERMENSKIVYTKNGTKTKVSVEKSVMDKALSQLTSEERLVLDSVFNFYNTTMRAYLIDTQMKNMGFSNTRDNYYPIVSADQYKQIPMQSGVGSINLNASVNGRMKSLSNNKTKIEINIDPEYLLSQYIDQMANSNQVGVASEKLNRTFNLKGEDGESLYSLANEFIPDGKKKLIGIRDRLIGNMDQYIDHTFVSAMVGKWATTTLGFNIRPVMKQFGSYFLAMKKLGYTNGIKAFIKPKNWSSSANNAYVQPLIGKYINNKSINYLKENNGLFMARVYNNDIVGANVLTSNIMQNTTDAFSKVVEKSLWLMGQTDEFTCYMAFAMAQETVKQRMEYEIGTDENLKAASELMTDVILDTQSNSDRIMMSDIRSGVKGNMARYLFGMFQADNQNKASMILEDYINSRANPDSKMAAKRFATTLGVFMMSAVWEILANLIADWFYNKEDPQDFDVTARAIDLGINSFVDWIPLVGTMVSWFEYGEASIGATSYINDIIDTIKDIADYGFTMKTGMNLVKVGVQSLTGLPIGNVLKTLDGFIGNFSPKTAIEMKSLFYGVSETYLTQNINSYAGSGRTKKTSAYVYEYYSLYKFGITDDTALEIADIKSSGTSVSVHSRLTEIDGVTLTDKEQQAFNEVYNLTGTAVDKAIKNTMYQTLNSNERASVIKRISDAYYNLAKSKVTGGSPSGRMAKLLNYGVDITKYAVYMARLNGLEGKTQIIQNINKMKGLSRKDKLILCWLMGYSVDSSAFSGIGLKPSQINELLS